MADAKAPEKRPWSIAGIDAELERCCASLKASKTKEAHDDMLDEIDRLLDRRIMLARCEVAGIDITSHAS